VDTHRTSFVDTHRASFADTHALRVAGHPPVGTPSRLRGHPPRLWTPTACACCACGHPPGLVRGHPHPRVPATGSQHGDRNRWAHGLPPARGQAEETQPVEPTAASHRSDSLSRIHEAAAPRSAHPVRAPLGDEPHDTRSPSAAGREPGPRSPCGGGSLCRRNRGAGSRRCVRRLDFLAFERRSGGLEQGLVGRSGAKQGRFRSRRRARIRGVHVRWAGDSLRTGSLEAGAPRGPRRANVTRWS
jgi:hypothetical protein